MCGRLRNVGREGCKVRNGELAISWAGMRCDTNFGDAGWVG
jgi:hypothetical protein